MMVRIIGVITAIIVSAAQILMVVYLWDRWNKDK